jgi:hypothetical protein
VKVTVLTASAYRRCASTCIVDGDIVQCSCCASGMTLAVTLSINGSAYTDGGTLIFAVGASTGTVVITMGPVLPEQPPEHSHITDNHHGSTNAQTITAEPVRG